MGKPDNGNVSTVAITVRRGFMSDYSIISNCSDHMVTLLREKMCPEPIPSANNIQVSSPASQDVDYLVGVYLYDIVEMQDVALGPNIRKGRVRLTRPPRPYTLYYCIFVNGGSQMGLKDLDVQKILGKVVQILNDNDSASYPTYVKKSSASFCELKTQSTCTILSVSSRRSRRVLILTHEPMS